MSSFLETRKGNYKKEPRVAIGFFYVNNGKLAGIDIFKIYAKPNLNLNAKNVKLFLREP